MKDIEKITISKLMDMSSHRIPDMEVFVFPETGKRYTYEEFEIKINEACKGLIAQGITKGEHVGLWMDNIEEWYILFYAINKMGAIAVPINSKYSVDEMDYILRKFDIDMLVMSEGYKKCHTGIIDSIIPNMVIPNTNYPRMKKIVTIDFSNSNSITYQQMIESGKDITYDTISKFRNNTYSNDVCIILPTSGTTGYSKGVQLTNIQLIQNGFDIGERYCLSGKDRMLIQVPMVHCFGITLSMLAALTHCTSMSVVSQFDATKALKIIEQEKITCINGVPAMYSDIINHEHFNDYDLSSLTKGIMAGCNCFPEFIEEVESIMDMKIISVYGLSEASPGCTMSAVYDSEEERRFTVGSALPNIECKIIDPETGEEVGIGEPGEFVVRGYNVMQGYYNDEQETERVMTEDGFLHTGDAAIKRPDGAYTIIGRYKDMIIRGGENIYPSEVARIINEIPGVRDTCIFGVDDPTLGQEVKACIIRENETITIEYIKNYMRGKCAKYKIPRYIEFVPEFIKNTAGKTLTYKMKQQYSN